MTACKPADHRNTFFKMNIQHVNNINIKSREITLAENIICSTTVKNRRHFCVLNTHRNGTCDDKHQVQSMLYTFNVHDSITFHVNVHV